jgi:hypothetical protein
MAKQQLKAYISIRKSWAESAGPTAQIFLSEDIVGDVISVPVLDWDISLVGFVEITFRPQKNQRWVLGAVIPAQQVLLIIGSKTPEALGFAKDLGFAKKSA